MGCCGTKHSQLQSDVPKKPAHLKDDAEYCVAYVKKEHLKQMLERLEGPTNDQTIINKLMLHFNKEVDLNLLFEQTQSSKGKSKKKVKSKRSSFKQKRQESSAYQTIETTEEKEVQTEECKYDKISSMVQILVAPAIDPQTGEEAIMIINSS